MLKKTLIALLSSVWLCLACYVLLSSPSGITSKFLEIGWIAKNQAIIHYEEAEGELKATVSWQGKKWRLCLANQVDLIKDKESFYRLLQNPGKTPEAFEAYFKMAYQMYNHYLEPIVDVLKEQPEKLLIIPSPNLYNTPFEVFKENPFSTQDSIKSDYIGQRFRIAYSYSEEISSEKSVKKNLSSKIFLGIAPDFRNQKKSLQKTRQHTLGPLFFHKKEVQYIGDLIGVNAKISVDTTKAKVLEEASHYQILHLATHSAVDPSCPEESGIFLMDTTITIQDLEDRRYPGEMAVLSSCFSGYHWQGRDGTYMSLAKAFQKSGWKSTVSSLWALDDWAAYFIMTRFYEYLKKGYTKDHALQQAKAVYLEESDVLHQHPYYWAGLVLHGDNRPIDLGSRLSFEWWLLIILPLILCMLVFSRKTSIPFMAPRA